MSPPYAPNLINRIRSMPLTDVLQAVGAQPDRNDKARWHTVKGTISVTGAKFFNWNSGTGGGGAIDLAIQLCDFDFRTAVAWLNGHLHEFQEAPTVTVPQPSTFKLPAPAPGCLDRVVQYLLDKRCIPLRLVTQLIDASDFYADHRANAVFLTRGPRRNPVGAELRGTGPQVWRGMAPGSRKDQGYFCLRDTHSNAAIICESAIDAISCFTLHPDHSCISTAGATRSPAWLASVTQQYSHVYCGFDADPTGDAMAEDMIKAHPSIIRLRPSQHDWNDQLRTQR